MNNIAIIQQGSGKYLFSLPNDVTLKEGDRVKCDTRRGITDGIAFADSAWVDENVSQLIGKLTGAKFPLKSVVGRLEYLPFEKPQAANLANKYEGMSNLQLGREMCTRGSCHVCNDGRRKHDCLFADDFGSCVVNDANRADVIKYLLAEDAEAVQKPEYKPSEDKPEPIKLYCVKDMNSFGTNALKGDVCTFNPAAGALELPDGRQVGDATEPRSYDDWKTENPCRAACLVPLVKRPAKVGEYVLLDNDDCFCKNKKGDVVKVVDAPYQTTTFCFINDPTLKYSSGICVCFECEYSYVLDGYKPTPKAEPESEYYNGKVVCVDNGGKRFFEVGKVYCFYDGVIFGANGFYSSKYETLEKANCGIGSKFIEFKGEAHD